jgi:hypothetical protein
MIREVAVMKKRMSPLVLLLVLGSIGLRAQDFRKVEEILVRLDSTLKPVHGQASRATQHPADSLHNAVSTLSLAERIAILEKRVLTLSQPMQAAPDTSLLVAAVADLRKALEALKPTAPGTKFPSVKTGLLGQFQASEVQEQSTAAQALDPGYHQHWQRQMYLRRMRVLVGGSVSPQTSFFFESDAVNICKVSGGGTKANAVGMYVQDAQVQHVFAPEFSVIAGLQLVGITRNGLQSAATLMGLNYGTYQFLPTGPLDNSVGRDVGVNFRGFLADERLEYRAGVFSGRNLNLFSPFRGTLRVQYNFMDREKGFFYNGTSLGATKNVAVGGGCDVQGSYRGYALDAMADLPVNETFWLTVSGGLALYDGGGSDQDSTCFTGAIPRQTVTFLEAGVLLRDIGLQPYVKYESQSVHAKVLRQVGATAATLDLQNALRSNDRFGIGVNYFLTGHQASVKLLYEFVGRKRLTIDKANDEHVTTGECTLQFQFFVY